VGELNGIAPRLASDGKSVAFIRAEGPRISLVLCSLPLCDTRRQLRQFSSAHNIRWTPDGRSIAYANFEPGGNLFVQPRDGSAPTQLTHYSDDKFIVDFAWSLDGTQLAIARATIVNDVVVFSGFNPKR
jgi:Tol biopolymer transport system component